MRRVHFRFWLFISWRNVWQTWLHFHYHCCLTLGRQQSNDPGRKIWSPCKIRHKFRTEHPRVKARFLIERRGLFRTEVLTSSCGRSGGFFCILQRLVLGMFSPMVFWLGMTHPLCRNNFQQLPFLKYSFNNKSSMIRSPRLQDIYERKKTH